MVNSFFVVHADAAGCWLWFWVVVLVVVVIVIVWSLPLMRSCEKHLPAFVRNAVFPRSACFIHAQYAVKRRLVTIARIGGLRGSSDHGRKLLHRGGVYCGIGSVSR